MMGPVRDDWGDFRLWFFVPFYRAAQYLARHALDIQEHRVPVMQAS